MGFIHVPVTVRNPADASKHWEGTFLVDTSAKGSLVPRPILESIGITPKGRCKHTLADGKEAVFDSAPARMDMMGEIIGTTILFGEEDSEPLLGRIAMASVGIEVDPHNQTLTKIPVRPLVGYRRR